MLVFVVDSFLFILQQKKQIWAEEFLPSVDYAINVDKLQAQLPNVKFTPIEDALGSMARFYARAWDKHPQEREAVLEEFPKAWRAAIRRRASELCE